MGGVQHANFQKPNGATSVLTTPRPLTRSIKPRPGPRRLAAIHPSGSGGAEPSSALATLRSACATKRVPPDEVVAALAELEVDDQGRAVADFPACVAGTWRLVFAVPAPIPSWAYIPVAEDVVIDVEKGQISLASFVGPLSFRFDGACTFRCEPEARVFAMYFSFSSWQVKLFGWESNKRPREPTPKTYSFFAVADGVAAVRSSGTGGKTLMQRL